MSFLITILAFIVALGILVTVHEFGHYWVAKKLGIKVLRFSIGFGKPLWRKIFSKDKTELVIAALPIGGYVKMLDENEGEVPEAEKHRAFNRQSLPVKVAVVTAGPLFNLIFAVFAYWVVNVVGVEGIVPQVGHVVKESLAESSGFKPGDLILGVDGRKMEFWGQQRLYILNKALNRKKIAFEIDRKGHKKNLEIDMANVDMDKITSSIMGRGLGLYPYMPPLEAVIGEVLEGPAKNSGMIAGDRIIKINDKKIDNWNKLVEVVQASAGVNITVTYLRNNNPFQVVLKPDSANENNKVIGRIGITPEITPLPENLLVHQRYGIVGGMKEAVGDTYVMSVITLKLLYKMLTLEISSKNISGPITIAQYAGYSAKAGIDKFMVFLAIISISLGILNLLPVPVLDGGHLLFYMIEAVKGSPLSNRAMYHGQQIGIVMLIGLMLLAFYNDILRLI